MCVEIAVYLHLFFARENKNVFFLRLTVRFSLCFSFQELFCLGVAFVLGATAMISVLFVMWRVTAWISGCCTKKARRADLQRKMDQLGQHPLHQSSGQGVSYTRRPQGDQSSNQGVGLDDIVLQPSPLGSTILVRRVSSAPGTLKGTNKGLEQIEGEGASLLSGELGGNDLPAPP